MANYGIMRVAKRGRSAVGGLEAEANREEEDHTIKGRDFARSDIDWNLTKNNIFLVKTEGWQQAITKQIKEAEVKERKNSTIMIDAFYGASSDFFKNHPKEDWLKFFNECLEFHIKEYCLGDKKRVLNAVIHLDETTPHMQVASVPIFEDEKGFHLSARDILGGRGNFRKRQDKFYDEVSKKWSLERGEVRDWTDIKKHTTKREWQLATQEQELEEINKLKEQADLKGLQATQKLDKLNAKIEVAEALKELSKIFINSPEIPLVNVVKKIPAINAFGRELTPELVAIKAEDLEILQEVSDNAKKAELSAKQIAGAMAVIENSAREIHKNRKEAHEVAVDERVREAEEEKNKAISNADKQIDFLHQEILRLNNDLAEEKKKKEQSIVELEKERKKNNDYLELESIFPNQFSALRTERQELIEEEKRKIEAKALEQEKLANNPFAEITGITASEARELRKIYDDLADTAISKYKKAIEYRSFSLNEIAVKEEVKNLISTNFQRGGLPFVNLAKKHYLEKLPEQIKEELVIVRTLERSRGRSR